MTTRPGIDHCGSGRPYLQSLCLIACARRLAALTRSAPVLGATALLLVMLATPSSASPAYVGRVASANAASLSTSVTLTASRQVTAGDALLIAVHLGTSLLGGVSATDNAGNTYQVDVDQSAGLLSLSRLVVLSARNVRSLAAGATITLTFPPSGAYQVSVAEFSGLASKDASSSASGSTSTFSSGSAGTS